MWLYILVIIVAIDLIICYIKNHPATSTKQESRTSSSITSSQGEGWFRFEMPLSGGDSNYTTATFDEKNVYFSFDHGSKHLIGSYELRKDETSNESERYVFLDKDGREIGFVYKGSESVFISRLAIYDNFLQMFGREGQRNGDYIARAKYPMPASTIVGDISDHYGSGEIYDVSTGELIGRYSGNKYGAACAFCAITSEIHIHTKYHDFLSEWEKQEVIYVGK